MIFFGIGFQVVQVPEPAAGQALALLLPGMLAAELIAELAQQSHGSDKTELYYFTIALHFLCITIVPVYLFTLCTMGVIFTRCLVLSSRILLHHRASTCKCLSCSLT